MGDTVRVHGADLQGAVREALKNREVAKIYKILDDSPLVFDLIGSEASPNHPYDKSRGNFTGWSWQGPESQKRCGREYKPFTIAYTGELSDKSAGAAILNRWRASANTIGHEMTHLLGIAETGCMYVSGGAARWGAFGPPIHP